MHNEVGTCTEIIPTMLMMFYLNVFYLPTLKQVVGDVLVYTNDVLQCLHPIAYKASK